MSEERWTYAGRRQVTGGKLGYCWVDGDGRELFYATVRAGVVGAVYELDVERADDNVRVVPSPRFVDEPRDPRVAEWEAEDRAAYTADELRKRESRAKRASGERFGQLTLEQLRAQLIAQPPPRRAALLAQVLRYLGAA